MVEVFLVFLIVFFNFWLDPKVTKDQALVSRRSNRLSISKMLRTRYAQTMIIFNELFKHLTLACKTEGVFKNRVWNAKPLTRSNDY